MADLYDLNAIRDKFHADQRKQPGQAADSRQVYVDRQGTVRLGTGGESDAPLSSVPLSTFAALSPAARLKQERRIARTKLPGNAYYEDTPGAEGWVYEITTTFHRKYVFCAHFDGAQYQVRLIAPELETLPAHDQHGTHLYHSGKLCLSSAAGSGQATLEAAYARSAVWALGVDFVVLYRQPFPFNHNQ